MSAIIEVNHVWKSYRKGIDKRYKSLRESIVKFPQKFGKTKDEYFWALEDLNFKVEQGQTVGIIGQNGAGKSTLLKIISRISPPTKGEVVLRGRVASLLEVGTGFHPELNGWENVYFNGSILGMKYREIREKFDEIVEFAGVEEFINTPLKHFSSGMQMRLAFSVAAHFETEILMIDEVLAVGDITFQKKCIDKMKQLITSGNKTIIFVTHDFNSLKNICDKSILINNGKLLVYDDTPKVLNHYYEIYNLNNQNDLNIIEHRQGDQSANIFFGTIYEDNNTADKFVVRSLSDICIELEMKKNHTRKDIEYRLDIGINHASGQRITWLSTLFTMHANDNHRKLYFKIKSLPLAPGSYDCNILLASSGIVIDWIKNVLSFEVIKGDSKDIPPDQGYIVLNYDVQ